MQFDRNLTGGHTVYRNLDNSTLISPTGISLSEDVDTTYSSIFAEYDQNLRALRGCYEGLKPPKKAKKNEVTPERYLD